MIWSVWAIFDERAVGWNGGGVEREVYDQVDSSLEGLEVLRGLIWIDSLESGLICRENEES